jgi:hypothetical protein
VLAGALPLIAVANPALLSTWGANREDAMASRQDGPGTAV